jgi:hypothetical protein
MPKPKSFEFKGIDTLPTDLAKIAGVYRNENQASDITLGCYSIVDYAEQTILLDFHRSAEKAQGPIYQKLIAAKKSYPKSAKVANEEKEARITTKTKNSLQDFYMH